MFNGLFIKPVSIIKTSIELFSTIYGISSGFSKKCGIAVFRISGKNTVKVLDRISRSKVYACKLLD